MLTGGRRRHRFETLFLTALTLLVIVQQRGISSQPTPKLSFVLSSNETLLNVTAGDSFLIVCGHPNEWYENAPVTWIKDGQPMEKDDFPRIIMSNLNLQFERVSREDAGIYECEVKDYDGEPWLVRRGTLVVKKKKKVVVDDYSDEEEISSDLRDKNMSCDFVEASLPPSSRTETENTSSTLSLPPTSSPYICFDLSTRKKKLMTHYLAKPAGSTVTIFCNARGNPKPTIQWYKNNKPFVEYGYQHKVTRQGLQIQDSNPGDSALYRCEASNGVNETISYDTEYVVVERALSSPIFTEKPANVTELVGGTIRLSVQILSDPEYSLVWVKHALHDPNNSSRVESRTRDPLVRQNNHLLVLENATFDDEGWYSCVVGNSIGKSFESAYVKILSELVEPVTQPVHSHQYMFGIFIFIGFTVFAFTLICVFSMWKRSVRKSHTKPGLNFIKQVIIDHRPVADDDDRAIMIPEVNIKNIESTKGTFQEYELPMDLNWEFPRDRLEVGKHLGEGAFGEVKQGIADGIIQPGVKTLVAIKALKKIHTDADLIDLMSEMETMKVLGRHTNIINLLGCCTQGGELLVIMEMAQEGNLKDYLKHHRKQGTFLYEGAQKLPGNVVIPIEVNKSLTACEASCPLPHGKEADGEILTFADLMSIAFQVARGMSYLVQRKYVHRDLAARNVLMCQGKIVKIADFGMARSTFTNDYYRKKTDGRVPLRWMAPETIFHRIYTTNSDVWSYGVLLWEIVTLGGQPYPSMGDNNDILGYLQSGKRMEQPPNCPTELYLIMRDCWMESPPSRPSFNDLVEDVGRILSIASGTEYLELEGVRPMDYENTEILTPPSSPETSASNFASFDPEFLKTFT